ncbi:MAG: HAMP domain-containing histidine kinase [Planctomycetes bacterium]|nr:HAMP domain-containing histidine kinase [Planctomycetota bacterium]
MTASLPLAEPAHDSPDLAAVLAAWDEATQRLHASHETLRAEVRRLSDELAVKNKELARKNRLADLGQMASHVAHEVRNSLMPLTLYSSLLRRRLAGDADTLSFVDKIDSGLTALEATVNDLLNFTRDRDPQWRSFSLHGLLQDVCESLKPQFAAQGVSVEVDAPPDALGFADADMLRRCVLNLMLNALDAMPEGGQLVLTACTGSEGLDIEVADSGPGISPDDEERLFEPFFTTKSEGTGLGLAIVQRIAEAHRGRVCVRNCPEGGAAFTIHIPRPAERRAA